MKKISRYSKLISFTYIKTSLAVLFFCLLCTGDIVTFEKSGDNYFHLMLNGTEVGTLGDLEQADELLTTARRNIAKEEEELVFIDVDYTSRGEEVLWGRIDSEETILRNMEEVLRSSVRETMRRSYTVKVNEYMANLSSAEEVNQLLQAAVDKYDTEQKFCVELKQDQEREFNVLTTEVVQRDEQQDETPFDGQLYPEAGFAAEISRSIAQLVPEVEKDFEDYELGLLSIGFAEEVEIVEAYLPESQLKPLDQAINELTMEQEMQSVYEVVSGDTLSEIAIKVNIPMEQIIAMNQGILENENSTLQVGDELVITVPEPELSVQWQQEQYIEEVYDAEVVYVDNDSWYTNQTQVLQQPSAGFRRVIAVSSYVNDKEVGREIVKEEIVMEAVPKIIERGTRIPPKYIKPISGGRQTSGFGYRNRPTKGASTYHKAIDWATPTGTAVRASSGGTVAKAGWGSSYGYVVYINHPDGRQTRYAHCSKLLVKAGQTVKQGDKIALSGNTGVSTGPHLHFEMLINGKNVNPLDYLE